MGYGYPPGQNARPVRPLTPVAPRPDNRGGAQGAQPFPSLTPPRRPAQAPSFTHDQVTASLAANPHAAGAGGSPFAYQGQQGPMPPQYPPPNPAPVPPVAPNVSYDYNTDPILQQAKALTGRNRTDAQSGALAAKKQLAIDYNDTSLANQLGDPNTAAAAAGNQFGVLEQLKHSYDAGAHNLDEQLNNQNLFYGGHRVQEQGNLAHDYQGQLANAAGQEQGLLGGIGDSLLSALSAADAADIAASQDAANRGIANPAPTGAGPAAPPPVDNGPLDPVQAALSGLPGGGLAPAPRVAAGVNNVLGPSQAIQSAAGRVGAGVRSLQGVPVDPLAAALAQQQKNKLLGLFG